MIPKNRLNARLSMLLLASFFGLMFISVAEGKNGWKQARRHFEECEDVLASTSGDRRDLGASPRVRGEKKKGHRRRLRKRDRDDDEFVEFESEFWVEYNDGTDTISEYTKKENKFINSVLGDSYNNILACSLGIFLGRVDDDSSEAVEINVMEVRSGPPTRKLQRVSANYRSLYTGYKVKGVCKSCSNGGPLFNDATEGRRLQETLTYNEAVKGTLVEGGFTLEYVRATNGNPLDDFSCDADSGQCSKSVPVSEFSWPEREHTNESQDSAVEFPYYFEPAAETAVVRAGVAVEGEEELSTLVASQDPLG